MKVTKLQTDMISFGATDVLRSLGMPPDHYFGEIITDLLKKTKNIASPKAFYMECPVEKVTENCLYLAGVPLCSRLLVKNLSHAGVVYPYLCTCGTELAAYGETLTDMSEIFAFDAIMNFYEKQAAFAVEVGVVNVLPEGLIVAKTSPGALSGWPINEQKQMFRIFGAAAAEIGVTLKENNLMTPLKSVSGICYGVTDATSDCIYCRKGNCPRRKAEFDEKAYLETLYRS